MREIFYSLEKDTTQEQPIEEIHRTRYRKRHRAAVPFPGRPLLLNLHTYTDPETL